MLTASCRRFGGWNSGGAPRLRCCAVQRQATTVKCQMIPESVSGLRPVSSADPVAGLAERLMFPMLSNLELSPEQSSAVRELAKAADAAVAHETRVKEQAMNGVIQTKDSVINMARNDFDRLLEMTEQAREDVQAHAKNEEAIFAYQIKSMLKIGEPVMWKLMEAYEQKYGLRDIVVRKEQGDSGPAEDRYRLWMDHLQSLPEDDSLRNCLPTPPQLASCAKYAAQFFSDSSLLAHSGDFLAVDGNGDLVLTLHRALEDTQVQFLQWVAKEVVPAIVVRSWSEAFQAD